MENKNATIASIAGLIAIISVFGLGYAYIVNNSTKIEDKTISNNEQNAEIKDWSTYKNREYGYSFKYPSDFVLFGDINQTEDDIVPVTDKTEVVSFLPKSKLPMLICCETSVSSITPISGSIDIYNWRKYVKIPDYRVISEKEVSFGGKRAYEVRGSEGIDSPGARAILLSGAKNSFVIIQGSDGEVWEAITNSFSLE